MYSLLKPADVMQVTAENVKVGDVLLQWINRIPSLCKCSANATRLTVTGITVNGTAITFTTNRDIPVSSTVGTSVSILAR